MSRLTNDLRAIAAVTATLALAACSDPPTPLQSASTALSAATATSVEYSGTGKWFQFGQAPNPNEPWPAFDVSEYKATVRYDQPAANVRMTRKQIVDPNRARPAPVEQKADQFVAGGFAWNVAGGNSQSQPGAVAERTMEIRATPHGFLKAAAANNATATAKGGATEVSFTAGAQRFVGVINAQNRLEKVTGWIDDAVLGDMAVEFAYSDYKDFGGVTFPGRIVRSQGGYPVLDITVTAVKLNPGLEVAAPDAVKTFAPPPTVVTAETLAPGVTFLAGGSHHSVLIEQADHVVVVEGPQHEARAAAVIDKVKELIPAKPLRYVINTHVHFDHSGGLRTFVDAGATVVTHEVNKAYYERAWAAPKTIAPDRLAASKKAARFETFTGKHVMTDGARAIELHEIAGNGHSDGFTMVWLPAEKILIQVDAYTPPPDGAPMPPVPPPPAVNLYENIQRLGFDVERLVPLHSRLATMADLRAFIGMPAQ
jgi:glyoxylase-like metal-dependent hydrolase (beta-lactamase superfamily II)